MPIRAKKNNIFLDWEEKPFTKTACFKQILLFLRKTIKIYESNSPCAGFRFYQKAKSPAAAQRTPFTQKTSFLKIFKPNSIFGAARAFVNQAPLTTTFRIGLGQTKRFGAAKVLKKEEEVY